MNTVQYVYDDDYYNINEQDAITKDWFWFAVSLRDPLLYMWDWLLEELFLSRGTFI